MKYKLIEVTNDMGYMPCSRGDTRKTNVVGFTCWTQR